MFIYFKLIKNLFYVFFFNLLFQEVNINLETTKMLFNTNCLACHSNGSNLIIPEKSLKKDVLKSNGMNNIDAISYQILNGKNGMPAFGGRLTTNEIKNIANYVLKESEKNFEE